jgi:hypothetical protein
MDVPLHDIECNDKSTNSFPVDVIRTQFSTLFGFLTQSTANLIGLIFTWSKSIIMLLKMSECFYMKNVFLAFYRFFSIFSNSLPH